MRILVTGGVACGKSTASKQLIEYLKQNGYDFTYWNISDIVLENGFYINDDDNDRFQTHVVDEDKLFDFLSPQVSKINNLLVDHHSFDMFKQRFFDLCILVSCRDANGDLKCLRNRLEDRGYQELKIQENISVEIYGYFKKKIKRLRCPVIDLNTCEQDEVHRKSVDQEGINKNQLQNEKNKDNALQIGVGEQNDQIMSKQLNIIATAVLSALREDAPINLTALNVIQQPRYDLNDKQYEEDDEYSYNSLNSFIKDSNMFEEFEEVEEFEEFEENSEI